MTASLKSMIAAGEFVTAPGVYDMISTLVADRMGFPALYMTGYGTVASHLGLPDAGLATYSDMMGRARQIAERATTPLIADADTGYGGLLNVRHTVRGYEAAGVAAIQIEDQEFPKKCGHTANRRVIPAEAMVRKVQVAVDSRSSDDFLIIARTDARTGLGLDEAIRRGVAYAEAGADVVFVESPESEDEMRTIAASIDAPVVANMVQGGRTPVVPCSRLEELGYAMALLPAAGFLATAAALEATYADILANGGTSPTTKLYSFEDFNRLVGFPEIHAFERKYPED